MGKFEKFLMGALAMSPSAEKINAQNIDKEDNLEKTKNKIEVSVDEKKSQEDIDPKKTADYQEALAKLQGAYAGAENFEGVEAYSMEVFPAESIQDGKFQRIALKEGSELESPLEFEEKEVFVVALPKGEHSIEEIKTFLDKNNFELIGKDAANYLVGLSQDLRHNGNINFSQFLGETGVELVIHAASGQIFKGDRGVFEGYLTMSEGTCDDNRNLMVHSSLDFDNGVGLGPEAEIGSSSKLEKHYVIAYKKYLEM